MSEIKLHERYPMSRTEDITDAYMRGFQACVTSMCDPLRAENAALRKELEMEREDNESMRALFDAVAPRCGKPDCPSLVEYVDKLRELVRDMNRNMTGCKYHHSCGSCDFDECIYDDRMRELGIEVTP